MKIVIGSAGRRVYLVHWFQQAFATVGVPGEVIVFDHDPYAASVAAADGHRAVPAYLSPDYAPAMLQAVEELGPGLFITLNDHELTLLADGLADQLRDRGVVVPVLDREQQRIAADKLQTSVALEQAGISVPRTALLSDPDGVRSLLERGEHFIIKDRFGSASSGLIRLDRSELSSLLTAAPQGISLEGAERVVQIAIAGEEYGVDIIAPLTGGPVQGLLGRKIVTMRNGESATAVTTDSTPFIELGQQVNALLGIRGLCSLDVIVDRHGIAHVIDINPRFSGGYPFSHLAGADVPQFMVASLAGRPLDPEWAHYRHGIVSAKHEGIISFGAPDRQHHSLQHSHL
ncbi:MAG: ATP-grasp domain-containing protein [Micrococcaceae bacterium]